MVRERQEDSAPRGWRSPRQQRQELDALRRELGEELPPELLEHLEDLQRIAEEGIDFDDPQAVEAALRRLEYRRIEREFKPRAPLYGIRVGGEGETVAPKNDPDRTPPEKKDSMKREERRRSYQSDPRYREFYERLRQSQREKQKTNYDEPPEFSSLEELERTGWDGTPRPWEQQRRSAPSRGKATGTDRPSPRQVAPSPPAGAEDLVPGTIMRFDDGSIAIYKDAVSGKDYALFYFLEPGGALVPQGIFLEQYDRQRLGQLPADLFEAMIRSRHWDRDAVIYYLDRFEYAGFVRALAGSAPLRGPGEEPPPMHVRRAPAAGAGGRRASEAPGVSAQPPQSDEPKLEAGQEPVVPKGSVDETEGEDSGWEPRGDVRAPEVLPPPTPPKTLLERGRVLRISVGPGKVWEAVYWTSDEMGPIVAHNTNREWSLMHLDLSRFKDALEYGELLSEEKLDEIEQSLIRQRG